MSTESVSGENRIAHDIFVTGINFFYICHLKYISLLVYFLPLLLFPESQDCKAILKAPRNGRRSVIEQDGAVKYIKFNCNDGYSLRGYSLAECRNGKWSSSTPVCAPMY